MDTNAPTYKRDSKWYEDREAEWEARQRVRAQAEWWCAKHPGCCPYCGRPESVHERLGGCPYFSPELDTA